VQKSGPMVLAVLALLALGAAALFLNVSTGPDPVAPEPAAAVKPSTTVTAPTTAATPPPPPARPHTPSARPSPPGNANDGNGTMATSTGKNVEKPDPPTAEELEAALDATNEGVQHAMVEMRPMLAQCYGDALADVPDLAPRLDLKFTVSNRHGLGRARGLSIANEDVDDPAMVDCMSAALEGLSFKPPGSPMSVTFPMAFR
jgi:hypothetical protein